MENTLYVEKWWAISSYPITTDTDVEISISVNDLRDMEELKKALPESKVQEMIKSKKLYVVVPPHATIVTDGSPP
jgi:adenylate cyclase class IV